MPPKQRQRILAHGKALLNIFPHAQEQDPIKLCKSLRRMEGNAASLALRLCNGPEFPGGYEQVDTLFDNVRKRVNKLLGNLGDDGSERVPIKINRDPRGYALKIPEEYVREQRLAIVTDFGGYGIIAPDLSTNE